jgi:hypothetical protein
LRAGRRETREREGRTVIEKLVAPAAGAVQMPGRYMGRSPNAEDSEGPEGIAVGIAQTETGPSRKGIEEEVDGVEGKPASPACPVGPESSPIHDI